MNAPPPPRPADDLGPGLGQAVILLLALQIVMIVSQILARLYRVDLWLTFRAGGFVTQEQSDRANTLVSGAGGIGGLAFIVTAVVWLIWQHRAQQTAAALAGDGLRFTPGWAVGWWFIPIANFWKPFQTVRELWKASHGPGWQTLATWSLLGWWWAAWLAGWFTVTFWSGGGQVGVGPTPDTHATVSSMIANDRWSVFRLGAQAIAAVFAIMIVRSVGRLQARAARVRSAALVPAAPAAPDPSGSMSIPPPPVMSPLVEDSLGPGERAWILGVVIAMVVLTVGGTAWVNRPRTPGGPAASDVPIAALPSGDLTTYEDNGVRFSYPSNWILGPSASHGTHVEWPDPMWSTTLSMPRPPALVGVLARAYRLPHDASTLSDGERRALVTGYANDLATQLGGSVASDVGTVSFGHILGYQIGVEGTVASAPLMVRLNVLLDGPFAYVVRCQWTPPTEVLITSGCQAIVSTYDIVSTPPVRVS